MQAIWQFELNVQEVQLIEMPEGAELLTVQTVDDMPCMWALVNTTAAKVKVTIQTVGVGYDTGLPAGKNYKYIGTYQLVNVGMVYHIYQILNHIK